MLSIPPNTKPSVNINKVKAARPKKSKRSEECPVIPLHVQREREHRLREAQLLQFETLRTHVLTIHRLLFLEYYRKLDAQESFYELVTDALAVVLQVLEHVRYSLICTYVDQGRLQIQ